MLFRKNLWLCCNRNITRWFWRSDFTRLKTKFWRQKDGIGISWSTDSIYLVYFAVPGAMYIEFILWTIPCIESVLCTKSITWNRIGGKLWAEHCVQWNLIFLHAGNDNDHNNLWNFFQSRYILMLYWNSLVTAVYLGRKCMILSSLVVEITTLVCTCCSRRCTLKWIFQHVISQHAKDQDLGKSFHTVVIVITIWL